MSVNLSPVAGAAAQFLDNSGNVLTGGKLYTYAAGTTTPQATYTSSAGDTFHSNPIILDASGRVPNGGEIWLTDGLRYKFVLMDSNNVLIGTWDNIIGINSNFVNYSTQEQTFTATQSQTVFTLTTITYTPATNSLNVFVNGSKQIVGVNYIETNSTTVTFLTGLNVGDVVDFTTAILLAAGVTNSNLIVYNQGGANAVNRTVQAKLQESVSVLDFGAVADNSTNNTPAFQNAINYCIANGKALYVPGSPLPYLFSGVLNIAYATAVTSSLKMYGDSDNVSASPGHTSVLKFGSGSASYQINILGNTSGVGSGMPCIFEGLTFLGTATAAGAMQINRAGSVVVRDCNFIGFTNAGNVGAIVINAIGGTTPFCGVITIDNCKFQTSGTCILFSENNSGTINIVRVINCSFSDQVYGLLVQPQGGFVPYTNNIVVNNCVFQNSTAYDVYSQGAAYNWCIEKNWFEINSASANPRIFITGSDNSNIVVKSNTFEQTLANATNAIVAIANSKGVEVTNNFSNQGGFLDRYSVFISTSTNVVAEPMNSINATPYPLVINNQIRYSGRCNEKSILAMPTGAGNFVGIASGDGWPGGTVCTFADEYNKNNALISVNFNATITTKSASGTSTAIGLLPYYNSGQAVYFPVYTTNVTGTKPFYGVLANGVNAAVIYDGNNAALNYQTACAVGSTFTANFTYSTTG